MPDHGAGRIGLKAIADTILDRESGHAELRDATQALFDLCSDVIGLAPDGFDDPADLETRFDHGRALSPRDAARCTLDFARTTAFIRGVDAAIIEARRRHPGSRINVLYAGCGPFAPLVLPLTTRFDADALAITLLDIHEFSIDSVERLVECFDASAWIASMVCCNALDYLQPATLPCHLLIIEALQKALEHEPQVSLTARLAPQMAAGGILIPERIRVEACLADSGAEFVFRDPNTTDEGSAIGLERRRFELGPLVELTKDGLSVGIGSLAGSGPTGSLILTIPNEVVEYPDLMIRTTVEVFGDHRLDDYDSGISYPTMIRDMGRLRPGDRLAFEYDEGPSPGLRIRRVSTP